MKLSKDMTKNRKVNFMAFGIFSINIKRHLRRGLSCFSFIIFVLILIVGISKFIFNTIGSRKRVGAFRLFLCYLFMRIIRISI